jgi:transposase
MRKTKMMNFATYVEPKYNKKMEKKYLYFVGIDISKEHLDFAIQKQGEETYYHKRVANQQEAIEEYLQEELSQDVNLSESLFCMENTGIYTQILLRVLVAQNCSVWLEHAMQIKQSGGVNRGKDDKIDAQRIAQYAARFQDKVRLYAPSKKSLEKLKVLQALRNRLVKAQKQLKTPFKESKSFVEEELVTLLGKNTNPVLEILKSQIKAVEKQIKAIITHDEELKEIYDLTTSVKGVGLVTGVAVILATEAFKKIDDPKKFACYAGVAPFQNSSGKMKGRTKTSHIANKKMKALLQNCVTSSLRYQGEFRTYFDKKIAEGKKTRVVMNALRNKIIQRIFACVKSGQKYQENYQFNLLLS